jgi:hypothetical protein
LKCFLSPHQKFLLRKNFCSIYTVSSFSFTAFKSLRFLSRIFFHNENIEYSLCLCNSVLLKMWHFWMQLFPQNQVCGKYHISSLSLNLLSCNSEFALRVSKVPPMCHMPAFFLEVLLPLSTRNPQMFSHCSLCLPSFQIHCHHYFLLLHLIYELISSMGLDTAKVK